MKYIRVCTADHEEPSCTKCDFCSGDLKICNKCGPEFWWQNYRRTITE